VSARTRRVRDAAPFAGPLRYSVLVLALLVITVFMVSLAVSIGAVTVPLGAVWRSVGHHLGINGAVDNPVQDQIVWDLRVPRGLLAFVVGAGLAVAGTVIQATVRNPLGDPYLLGIVPGASAGAVLVIVAGSASAAGLSLSGAAFVGAMIAFVATFALSRQGGRWPPTRLILAGVAVGYLMSAITYYFESLADPNQLSGVLFWLLGSVSSARWSNLGLPSVVVVVSTAWLILQGRKLNALASGEETAASLGINVGRFQFILMTITSLLTAAVVAVAGGVGFVGLMVPHIVRVLVGADHRRVLLVAALLGGAFLLVADIAARTLQAPVELPIGIVTAAAGAPFFLWLLRSQLSDPRGR
jgi:iron complex transport system permease protein